VGRNFEEIVRMIDSIQLNAKHKVATPADWKQGGDVIITSAVSNEEADKKVPRLQDGEALSKDNVATEIVTRSAPVHGACFRRAFDIGRF